MTAPAAKAAPSCHSFTVGHVRVQAGHSNAGHEKLYGSGAAHCSSTGVPSQPASRTKRTPSTKSAAHAGRSARTIEPKCGCLKGYGYEKAKNVRDLR